LLLGHDGGFFYSWLLRFPQFSWLLRNLKGHFTSQLTLGLNLSQPHYKSIFLWDNVLPSNSSLSVVRARSSERRCYEPPLDATSAGAPKCRGVSDILRVHRAFRQAANSCSISTNFLQCFCQRFRVLWELHNCFFD
jgi:hypothetical protein